MKFVLASQNPHKLKEMNDILSAHGVEVVLESDIGLQVEVEDDGSPIPQQTLDRLFAYPFLPGAQFVRDGLGIGLGNICRRIKAYYERGQMCIDSREGEGTRVEISFGARKK